MNNVVVFGGTGDVGRIVVEKLLEQGRIVKILTRNEVLESSHINLHLIKGNVLEASSVEHCIESQDIVIIALGFNNSSLDTMSRGTANIVSAMLEKKCRRLVCISAQGAGDSWEHMPDSFKNMVLNDPILTASFKDHTLQEQTVKNSNLNWTIVRPTEIVDEIESGGYCVNGYRDNLTFQISKYDVAQFIVDETFNDAYVNKVAMITN
jgi:putative NADH-flavin reductase